MDTDPHAEEGPAKTGADQQPRVDRLTPLLTTVSATLGLLVTVTALNVDRSWRLVAIAVGCVGIVVSLVAFKLPRGRRVAAGAGVALLVTAGTVLVVSPPVAAPAAVKPQSQLKLSQFDIIGGTNGPPMFDITVHNLGKRLAVLTGVRLTIHDFALLTICISEGTVETGKPYPAALPYKPPAGTIVTIPLHEEVGADQVDRFQVALHPPQPKVTDATGFTYVLGGTFMYQLAATLTSDVQKSLPLGQAVIGTPLDPHPTSQVWDPDDPQRVNAFYDSLGGGSDLATDPDVRRALPCLQKEFAGSAGPPG